MGGAQGWGGTEGTQRSEIPGLGGTHISEDPRAQGWAGFGGTYISEDLGPRGHPYK